MTVARTVGWNVLVQLGSRAAQLGLSGFATLLLVRSLGPTRYGQYAFVLALVSVCGLISEAGLGRIVTREMSRAPADEATLLPMAVALRLALGLLATLVALLAVLVLRIDPVIRLGVAIASIIFFLDGLSSFGLIFQVRLKMQFDALAMVGGKLVFAGAVLVFAWRQAPVLVFIFAPVAGSATMALLAFLFARRLTPLHVRLDLARMRTILRDSIPSGIALLIAVLYLKLDGIMLGVFAGSTALGLYSAAYRPVEYLLLAASVVVNPVFPLLARTFAPQREQFLTIYQQSFLATLAAVVPIIAVSLAFAPQLLGLVFGEEYAASAAPYRLLMGVLPLLYCNGWQALALLVANKQRVTVLVDTAGLVVNVIANLLLIPSFGPLGCAFAALLTALVVSNGGNLAARHYAQATLPGAAILKVAAAGLASTGLMILTRALSWPVAALLGLVLYALLLPAFRVVSVAQLKQLVPARATLAPSGEIAR